MRSPGTLVCAVLREPAAIAQFSVAELDLLLRVAGPARLTSRLDARVDAAALGLPRQCIDRLHAAGIYARRLQVRSRFEVDRLAAALGDLAAEVVLLKGAAYLLADLEVARGRWFADVDLLAHRSQLEAVEARLLGAGWEQVRVSDYDDAYYREWTHELPPMMHPARYVEADLHHTISPVSGRLKVDGGALMERARPLDGAPFRMLCPEDLVLHAVVHLFQDGEVGDSIHQLYDIHLLLEALHDTPEAWAQLLPRATTLGCARPLYYALRYCGQLLGTRVPHDVLAGADAHAPPAAVRALMDSLVPRALLPMHPDRRDPAGHAARLALYVRSHWLRMPPLMLARHLGYKAWLRATGRAAKPTDPLGEPL